MACLAKVAEADAALNVSLENGTLNIVATGADTKVSAVRPFGFALLVMANADQMEAGTGCSQVSLRLAICPPTLTRLAFVGSAGDDVADLSDVDVQTTVDSGKGDDLILGGAGTNTIISGSGDDTVYGGPSTDRLDGAYGSDLLIAGAGSDTAVGGPGDDILDGGSEASDVIVGGEGDNTLIGDPGLVPATRNQAESAQSFPLANASVVVKDAPKSVAVRIRARTRNRRVRVCIRTKTKSGTALKPYSARVWPNRRDVVRHPQPQSSAWYAHADSRPLPWLKSATTHLALDTLVGGGET